MEELRGQYAVGRGSAAERVLEASGMKAIGKQVEFLEATKAFEYVLYGGSAGPGKSHALRWGLLWWHAYWAGLGVKGVTTGLFCESYPALIDRQVSKIERQFPSWAGEMRRSQGEGFGFHVAPELGGGLIALRNLDDAGKYASAEFGAIGVDELTKNGRQVFDDLRFRKRWPGVEHSPFMAATNPGSIGHWWVKKLWIDRDFGGDDEVLDPARFKFVKALAGENPFLPASYMRTLESLPSAMRRAMLEGSWDAFEGQVFDSWRADKHICKPFRVPSEWRQWAAIDYGYAAPFGCLFFASPPDRSKVYVVGELYRKGLRAREQAVWIRSWEKREGMKVRMRLADPSMWQRRVEGLGPPVAEEYQAEGVELIPANNNRLHGLDAVRDALEWKELPGTGRTMKEPRLQVFDTCKNLIRTVPSLPYDPVRVEDVDTNSDDHLFDCLRYGLMAELVDLPDGRVAYRMDFGKRGGGPQNWRERVEMTRHLWEPPKEEEVKKWPG